MPGLSRLYVPSFLLLKSYCNAHARNTKCIILVPKLTLVARARLLSVIGARAWSVALLRWLAKASCILLALHQGSSDTEGRLAMAVPSVIEPGSFVPAERDLARSEEEEKLLRHIREEKEQLWYQIQVSHENRVK